MKFSRKTKLSTEIPTASMPDIIFMLLIFFMVTTTFSSETRLLVNLPEATAVMAETPPAQIEILVTREGKYLINGRALVNSRIDTLMRGLALESAGDIMLPILLIADAEATHQSVITAMDAIGQSGFTRMNIATQRPAVVEGQTQDRN